MARQYFAVFFIYFLYRYYCIINLKSFINLFLICIITKKIYFNLKFQWDVFCKMNNGVGEMGFLEHLEELRWRIIKSLIALIIGTGISFGFINEILFFLLEPTQKTSTIIDLQVLSVQGMFLIKWFIFF